MPISSPITLVGRFQVFKDSFHTLDLILWGPLGGITYPLVASLLDSHGLVDQPFLQGVVIQTSFFLQNLFVQPLFTTLGQFTYSRGISPF